MDQDRNRAVRSFAWLLAAFIVAPEALVAQAPTSPAPFATLRPECVVAFPGPSYPSGGEAASQTGCLPTATPRHAGRASATTESLDLAIAHAVRRTDIQENGTAQAVAGVFRVASLPGTLLLAGALYGIGELQDRPDLSELGLNTGQAIVGAGAVTLAGKVAAGRARPRVSPENSSDFALGRGARGNDYQSFPSAHTAAAFAAATVLVLDVSDRHHGSAAWAYPSFYAAAGMAGLSRLFDEEHWASDILAGALIGIGTGLIVDRWHGDQSVP